MTPKTEPPSAKRPGADAAPWLLIGAVLLCPLSKIVTFAAVGGVFGGLLGMPWLLIIAGVAIAGSGWVLVRMLRRRGGSCRPPATSPETGHEPDSWSPKEKS